MSDSADTLHLQSQLERSAKFLGPKPQLQTGCTLWQSVRETQHSPSPKVMGHMEPSRAQLTRASTLDTTNSAAGLAEAGADVETGRLRHDAVEASGRVAWLNTSRVKAGAAAFKTLLILILSRAASTAAFAVRA